MVLWILLVCVCSATLKTTETKISLINILNIDSSHTRRASEKTKKRMKITDLKVFVETKLLSKSEKALENIAQEEPNLIQEQVILIIEN